MQDFINFESSSFIRDYLTSKFKVYRIQSGDREFVTNSPFVEDYKMHLWVELETGVWIDNKSQKRGNFISLYAYLEGITYRQAEIRIVLKSIDNPVVPKEYYQLKANLSLQEEIDTFVPVTINSAYSDIEEIFNAWQYLFSRRLFNKNRPDFTYYYAPKGTFADRVIFPFIKNNQIFFFQGRALKVNQHPKYLSPSTSYGINAGNVLYPFSPYLDHLILCEGATDAISMQFHNLNATCTLGCKITPTQLEMIKDFPGRVVVAYHKDKAGLKGLNQVDEMRKTKMLKPLYYCHPPGSCKDWNDAHIAGWDLKKEIHENGKEYNKMNYDILTYLETNQQ